MKWGDEGDGLELDVLSPIRRASSTASCCDRYFRVSSEARTRLRGLLAGFGTRVLEVDASGEGLEAGVVEHIDMTKAGGVILVSRELGAERG